MNSEKQLLRAADVAPLMGLTSRRIYQLISDGIIPSVRVGGAIRIPRAAWEEWLRGRSEEALASLRAATSAAGSTED